MTDARHRGLWHRTGLVGGASAMLLLAATTQGFGCSDGETGTPSSSSTTTTTTTTSSSGTGGGGGAGGAGGGSASCNEPPCIDTACNDDSFNTPFDATPDPEGGLVYFTALNSKGEAGVFRGPANGSGPCSAIVAGAPFVAPFSLAASTDGSKLYVADSGAFDDAAQQDAGNIFVVAANGGSVTPLSGTEGTRPRGIDVLKEAEGDLVYFTGVNKADGQHGLFRVPAAGGMVSVIAKGTPFVDPSGVAAATNGAVFVCDTTASLKRTASIYQVVGGSASPLVEGLPVGYPCGIALTTDEQTLLVSGLIPGTQTDVLYRVTIASKEVVNITKGIDTFSEPAGMHRSKTSDTFAWVDSKANTTGTVFTVKLK